MATTYTLIDSEVLSSSTTSVAFTSISADFTDLVVRWSVRTDYGNTRTGFRIAVNSITTNYTETYLIGLPGFAGSGRYSGNAYFIGEYIDGTNATSNTFGSGQIYIPSYTVSQSKPMSMFSAAEGNTSTDTGMYAKALLLAQNAAISSLTMTANTGNFVSGTSFYLYGISNA